METTRSVRLRLGRLQSISTIVLALGALASCASATVIVNGHAPTPVATATPPLAGQRLLEVRDETGLDVIGSVSPLQQTQATTAGSYGNPYTVTAALSNVGKTYVDYGPNSFYLLVNHSLKVAPNASPSALTHPLEQGTLAPGTNVTGQIAFILAPDAMPVSIVWVVATADGLNDSSMWVLRSDQ